MQYGFKNKLLIIRCTYKGLGSFHFNASILKILGLRYRFLNNPFFFNLEPTNTLMYSIKDYFFYFLYISLVLSLHSPDTKIFRFSVHLLF